MEAIELARWLRFAAKGGIGKCTALEDCIAEKPNDLMFLKDDEITVLMELSDPPGTFLGSCEGVVGRFDGSIVRLHGKLKRPVMAKRTSANPSVRQSPTPAATRTRISIDEHVAVGLSLPPSSPEGVQGVIKAVKPRLNLSRGSRNSSGQERSDGEYGSSRGASPAISSTLSPSLKGTPPPLHAASLPPSASYGSPKPPLRTSMLSSRHASVLSSHSQVTEYTDDVRTFDAPGRASVVVPYTQPTSSPHTTITNVPPSTATTITNPAELESTTIPPSLSSLTDSSLYASSSGASVAPTTTPSTSHILTSPPPTSLSTTSTIPDTGTTTLFDTSRLSIGSDGEVGIGLSLLQNLADADGWSGSESESEGVVPRRKASVRTKGSMRRRMSLRRSTTASSRTKGNGGVRASVVSRESRYSSEDGLNYADTEMGHSSHSHVPVSLTQETLDADILETQAAFAESFRTLDDDDMESPVLGRRIDTFNGNDDTLGQRMMTFPPVAPLSPSPSRLNLSNAEEESFASTYEFPTPPTHTHRISLSQGSTASTSMNSRPPSFVRPPRVLETAPFTTTAPTTNQRSRRPSTAQSTTSSNWHDDIYDDYRYSRISIGARSYSSHVSVGSRMNGSNGGAGEWPPASIDGSSSVSRSGTPSMRSVDTHGSAHGHAGRPNAGRTRSRSNTTASSNPVVLSPIIPQTTPLFVQSSPTPQTLSPPPPTQSPVPSIHQQSPPRSHQRELNRARSREHRTTDSESDGSRLSSRVDGPFSAPPSGRLNGSFSLAPTPFGALNPSSPDPNSNTSSSRNSTSTRPTPLKLTSSNHSSLVPLSAAHTPLSPNSQHQRLDSNTSPLLHTRWGSTASVSQYITIPHSSTTTASTTPSTATSSSPPSSGGRAMARQMSAFFTRAFDARAEQDVEVYLRGGRESGETKKVVVEEGNEEAIVSARGVVLGGEGDEAKIEEVGEDEDRDDEDIIGEDTAFSRSEDHESPSIASSPEPEPDRLVMSGISSSMVEDAEDDEEDIEELEREKEKLRKEAAGLVSPKLLSLSTLQEVAAPPPSESSIPTAVVPPLPTSTAPSHLRPPKLSDIRPSGERQSLFLPHPNAPKATPTSISPGPMYIASQTQPLSPQRNAQRVRGSVIQAIHLALTGQGPPNGPRGRGPTIYGIATVDLSAAMGPVPMQFTVTPPPATAPPPGSVPPPSLPRGAVPPPPPTPITVPSPRNAMRRVGSLDVTSTVNAGPDVERLENGMGGVIPRANFFPKAAGVRPRSRSFSGFQSITAEIPLQRSRDSNDQPAQMPAISEIRRSLTPSVGSPTTPTGNAKLGPRPSPLRDVSSARISRPPNSPLSRSFIAPSAKPSSSSVPSSPTKTSPPRLLRQTASKSTLNDTPILRPVLHTSTMESVGNSPSSSIQHTPELHGRLSTENDSFSMHSSKSNLTSPPPATIGRQNSLRAKLSLPNLRRNVNKQDDLSILQPLSPTADGDLLQVQHMDFELVRPTFGHLPGGRSSEDSGVMGRDVSVDARLDGKFLRPDSPTLSLTAPRSPTYTSDTNSSTWQGSKSSTRGGTDSEASSTSIMDAHRNRELKWMGVLGSVQPSQSRKSKKVKKLVFDGVPSSVRYRVWSMLTDGKARCVPGVYAQLGSRAKVAALVDIERDVQRCFADHPQLQNTRGPVISLLQAYLTMVPDVQYAKGLTLITGNLLLHAPEEDAFWIFVSLMDSHIRPYFSSTSAQVDIDGTLFGRYMDNVDPAMAKKLFGDLKISPVSICRPWFTSLFVGFLPSDYLNRVWDIFLFEGVPFLFRIALVLVSCSRQRFFDTTSADAALSVVLRPSPEFLPTSPEALITLALAVKVKDDDLRKQRVKLEAHSKRQTLAPRTVSTPGSISLPRS